MDDGRHAAHRLVHEAVVLGVLPPVTSLVCTTCNNQAREYHHPHGYEGTSAIDVIPLCKSCHRTLHQATKTPLISVEEMYTMHLQGAKLSKIAKAANIGRRAVYNLLRQYMDS